MAKELENISSLYEELEYRTNFNPFSRRKTRSETTDAKFKSILQKHEEHAKKVISVLESKNEYDTEAYRTQKRVLRLIQIKNEQKTTELKSISDCKNLIKEIRAAKHVEKNQRLIRIELDQREKEEQIILKKIENIHGKKSKLLSKLETKLIANRGRQKDLKDFIRNESASKKLYLSDEPPLTIGGTIKLVLSYLVIIFWMLVIIWPVYQLVRTTFNDAGGAYLNATRFEFGVENYVRLFEETNYLTWLWNTLYVSVITSVITVFSTLLMSYAFSRFRFKGRQSSLLVIMLIQMVPTMAALTVFYILFTIMNESLGVSPRWFLILIYSGGSIAGNTFIMRGYMNNISTEIDEAAKLDGLSNWRIFMRIIVPLTKPMIALIALWSFIGPFGDYILSTMILPTDDVTWTMARGLQSLINDSRDPKEGLFAAGAIITALPITLLFIGLRNFLIGGLTAGWGKG